MSVRGEKLEIQWVCQKPSGNRTEIGLDSNVDDERMYLKLLLKFMTQEMDQGKERI